MADDEFNCVQYNDKMGIIYFGKPDSPAPDEWENICSNLSDPQCREFIDYLVVKYKTLNASCDFSQLKKAEVYPSSKQIRKDFETFLLKNPKI